MDGKPYLKDLDDFGKVVLEDLWMAVVKQFVEVSYSARLVGALYSELN